MRLLWILGGELSAVECIFDAIDGLATRLPQRSAREVLGASPCHGDEGGAPCAEQAWRGQLWMPLVTRYEGIAGIFVPLL